MLVVKLFKETAWSIITHGVNEDARVEAKYDLIITQDPNESVGRKNSAIDRKIETKRE